MAEETQKQTASPSSASVEEVTHKGRRKNHPDNCVKCNKRLSKKQWYYRNGQFYCSKTCWQAASVKKAA